MAKNCSQVAALALYVGEDGERVHKGCTCGRGHGPISVGVMTGGTVLVFSFLCPQGGIVRMSALL